MPQEKTLINSLSGGFSPLLQEGAPILLCCHSERSEESFDYAQDRSGRLRPFAEFILSEAEGLRVT